MSSDAVESSRTRTTTPAGRATPPPVTRTVDQRKARRAVGAAAIGNFMEHYDFFLFGAYATVFAAIIFPESNAAAGLLFTFAIYGVAFVGRPLGALVFGHFGDKLGRRNTLAASIMLMVAATIMIGIAPTYAMIGVWAALYLFLARFLQGIALGGEFAGATSYLVEMAPSNRRALYGSFNTFTVGLGLLAGTGIGALISSLVSEAALQSWGWRIPFLLAAPLGLIGLYMRLRLDESPKFEEVADRHETLAAPLLVTIRTHWKAILICLGVTVVWTISAYVVLVYAPTYMITQLDLSLGTALTVQAVALGVYTIVVPLSALASDALGRKPILIAATLGFLLLTYPSFLLLQTGDMTLIVLADCILAGMVGLFAGAAPTALAEMFSTRVRYSALGIGFNGSVALFGGTAPLIVTALITATGNPLAPAWYLTLGAAVSLVVLVLIVRETGREPLAA